MNKIIVNAIIYGVGLNILVSYLLSFIATSNEIKPPNGANNLSFKSQIIHMFVHHKQVLFASSIIVGIVVGMSVSLAKKIPIIK